MSEQLVEKATRVETSDIDAEIAAAMETFDSDVDALIETMQANPELEAELARTQMWKPSGGLDVAQESWSRS